MTKKKKIIIAIVCIAVLIVALATSLILINLKKFKLQTDNAFQPNNHTIMTNNASPYTTGSTSLLYSNGTQIVSNNYGKQGIYSYVDGKMAVETSYDNITLFHRAYEYDTTYFQLKTIDNVNEIKLVNACGKDIGITTYNAEEQKAYAGIMSRDVEISSRKDKYTTKIAKDYTEKKVEISNITYNDYMYKKDVYLYEIWTITTADGYEYDNLYKVENGKHTLVQTINNPLGLNTSIDNIVVLENGDLRVIETRDIKLDGTIISQETKTLDINGKEKHTFTRDFNSLSNEKSDTKFRVGNNIYFQCLETANEDDYDFAVETGSNILYFDLITYKQNLKNGKLTTVNCKYIINYTCTDFSDDYAVLGIQKIKDKKLDEAQIVVANARLQTKEINYNFDYVTKINDDRFVVGYQGKDFKIINKKFELIANLDNFNNLFCTQNSIVGSDKDDNTYICDLNGNIVKMYSDSVSIENIYDDKYYLVEIENEKNDGVYREYYLETLGLRNKTPLFSQKDGESTYTYDSKTYLDEPKVINSHSLSLIVRTREENSRYAHDIYTFDGKRLYTVTTDTQTISVVTKYASEDSVVITIDGKYYTLDR